MATSKVAVTEGSGKNLATNSFTEDAVTKEVSRVVLNNSSGTEITALPVTDNSGTLSIDDGGGSITVDGTVAATQSGTWNVTNVSGTVSLPTGASTLAEQQTQTTALQLIDDTVKTDDAAFTPATDKVLMIGGLADETAPDVVDEGDAGVVRITTFRALHVNLRDASGTEVSVGGGTQYDEDTVHSSGDKLTLAGAVRRDSATSGASADGDRATINVDGNGKLWVNAEVTNTVTVGSHAVTNAGTFAVQESGAALTSLQLIDDAIVADDAAFTPATTKVMMAGFEVDDTTPDSLNEGDAGAARMSANRNIYMNIRDAAGNERGANVNASNQLSVSVDNTVTVGSHAVTNAGTFAVQVDGAALTSLQLIDDAVYAEDVASQNADKGIMILAKRLDTPANSSGTDGDYEPLQISAGRLWTSSKLENGKSLLSKGGSAASSGNNTLVAAGTNKLKVYAFSLSTTSTTAVTCIFQDGASGTELWRCILQAPSGANSGANLAISPPAWLFSTSTATLLNLNLSGAITVHWSVSYFDEA